VNRLTKRHSAARAVSSQLSLFRERGGTRPGAGRPASSKSRSVPHRARPQLSRHHPVHVTLRARGGLESLRKSRIFAEIRAALRAARERSGFRLVHFSVQGNHVHLLAEADDRSALSRGLQGSRSASRLRSIGLSHGAGPYFQSATTRGHCALRSRSDERCSTCSRTTTIISLRGA
jgi:REP element-mobilizing transposase RayT